MTRLQQGLATGGMGPDRHFAEQQSPGPNVRFGSKADIGTAQLDVRFTPESGHPLTLSAWPVLAKEMESPKLKSAAQL